MVLPTHIVAVAGIVENDRGEVLLVKDIRRDTWVYPGGQVEVGENLMDALIREVKEESGADIEVSKLIGISSNTATHPGYNGVEVVPTKVMFDFICTYIGGDLRPSDETSQVCWVAKEKLTEYLTAPHLVDKINHYLNYDETVQYLEYVTRPSYVLKHKEKV